MDEIIRIQNLTKDFGQGRGVFDVNLGVKEGEVYGLVGINGSGKSTIMRHLMGFLNPGKGSTNIMGKDCWSSAAELKKLRTVRFEFGAKRNLLLNIMHF